jgi:hypothetical protein
MDDLGTMLLGIAILSLAAFLLIGPVVSWLRTGPSREQVRNQILTSLSILAAVIVVPLLIVALFGANLFSAVLLSAALSWVGYYFHKKFNTL